MILWGVGIKFIILDFGHDIDFLFGELDPFFGTLHPLPFRASLNTSWVTNEGFETSDKIDPASFRSLKQAEIGSSIFPPVPASTIFDVDFFIGLLVSPPFLIAAVEGRPPILDSLALCFDSIGAPFPLSVIEKKNGVIFSSLGGLT